MFHPLFFCLLATALFLRAASLPFSDRHPKERDGAGKLNPQDTDGGASTTYSTAAAAIATASAADAGSDDAEASSPLSMFGYGCDCTRSGPSSEELEWLKTFAAWNPHPVLLFSEMAESVHRSKICRDFVCETDHPLSQQNEDDIVRDVTKIMLNYLNRRDSQVDDLSCSLVYNVTYYSSHYPRYLVEQVCAKVTDGSIVHPCTCSQCSPHPNSERCSLNHYVMPYLTSDPNEPGCKATEEIAWHRCQMEAGAGCSC